MVKPLALVMYENLLPGSQIVNRLRDLGYRVETVHQAERLLTAAMDRKPLLIVMDLAGSQSDRSGLISQLRQSAATQHIPVLAFGDQTNISQQASARVAGATLVASDRAILAQLPQLLEQLLLVE